MNAAAAGAHRIYAIGDIHGMSDALHKLLALIDRHMAAYPPSGPVTEVFLGDYVDRGPDSFGVIETLITPPDDRRRICLLGNHEDAMIFALNDANQIMRWLSFGGEATCLSYGLEPHALAFDPHALHPLLHTVIPPSHRDFLNSMERWVSIGDLLFVHAGIRPGIALSDQDPNDLIWIRDEFLEFDGPLPAHVVHGHTPVSVPDRRPYRTNVDTAAVYGGALTAAVIESDEISFLSVPTD